MRDPSTKTVFVPSCLSVWIQHLQVPIYAKLVSAPAIEAIQYEQKKLTRNIENNVFTGQPRPEHDAAWAKLLERTIETNIQCMPTDCLAAIAIKISEKELSHLEDPSIAFKDGSGYLGELSVYHELHCVVCSFSGLMLSAC